MERRVLALCLAHLAEVEMDHALERFEHALSPLALGSIAEHYEELHDQAMQIAFVGLSPKEQRALTEVADVEWRGA